MSCFIFFFYKVCVFIQGAEVSDIDNLSLPIEHGNLLLIIWMFAHIML